MERLMIRNAIIFLIHVVLLRNFIIPALLPYGPASYVPQSSYPVFTPLDLNNDSLRASSGKLQKIIERIPRDDATYEPLLKGPETVLFDDDGVMYVLTETAKLVSLTDFEQEGDDGSILLTAKATEVAYLGGGRPLGGKLVADENGISQTLYAADALLGLIRVRNIPRIGASEDDRERLQQPIVEIVANRVKLDDGTWSRILYADDVDIGPKTGHVYFTDATDIVPERIGTYSWDTMSASKVDLLRGERKGRLLRYKPETRGVDVLADGISFANGIGVNKDETFIVISETFAARYLKYHLQGAKQGQTEVILNELNGIPDGADCSHTTGLCYAAIITSPPTIMKIVYYSLPPLINRYARTFLMMVPKSLQPKTVPYGCFVEIFPGDGITAGKVTRVVQDLHGKDLKLISGVTEHQGKLYLGSLEHAVVGVYDLS